VTFSEGSLNGKYYKGYFFSKTEIYHFRELCDRVIFNLPLMVQDVVIFSLIYQYIIVTKSPHLSTFLDDVVA